MAGIVEFPRLVQQLRQGQASAWAHQTLTTIGKACRAVLRETLRSTLTWAMDRVTLQAWDKQRVVAHLGLT